MPIYRVELLKTYLVEGKTKDEIERIANNWAAKESRENIAATVSVSVSDVNTKDVKED